MSKVQKAVLLYTDRFYGHHPTYLSSFYFHGLGLFFGTFLKLYQSMHVLP